MSLRIVFATVNRMRAEGVIERYAVGSEVGATFDLEPIATLDVDIFVAFAAQQGLISPKPIFDFLTEHGAVVQGEYLVIAGWPLQFLPAGNALVERPSRKQEPSMSRAKRSTSSPPSTWPPSLCNGPCQGQGPSRTVRRGRRARRP